MAGLVAQSMLVSIWRCRPTKHVGDGASASPVAQTAAAVGLTRNVCQQDRTRTSNR